MVFLLKATEMPSLNYGEAQLHVATNEEQPSDGRSRTIDPKAYNNSLNAFVYISIVVSDVYGLCL